MSFYATVPEFWANSVLQLMWDEAKVLNVVNRDFSDALVEQGDTVNVSIPTACTMQDVSTTAFTSDDIAMTNVPVVMDKWRQTKPIKITDKILQMSAPQLINNYITPMAQEIVVDIEKSLIAALATATNTVGTSGTDPVTIATLGPNLKQKFDTLKIPNANRNVLLDSTAEAKYHELFDLNTVAGADSNLVTGAMGMKYGMTYFGSNLVSAALTAGYGFHRDAVTLVTRALAPSPFAPQGQQAIANFNGVGVRVSIIYDPKLYSTFITSDIIYGVKVLDQNRMFKIFGA